MQFKHEVRKIFVKSIEAQLYLRTIERKKRKRNEKSTFLVLPRRWLRFPLLFTKTFFFVWFLLALSSEYTNSKGERKKKRFFPLVLFSASEKADFCGYCSACFSNSSASMYEMLNMSLFLHLLSCGNVGIFVPQNAKPANILFSNRERKKYRHIDCTTVVLWRRRWRGNCAILRHRWREAHSPKSIHLFFRLSENVLIYNSSKINFTARRK